MKIACILRPDDRFLRRRIMECAVEKRRRRIVVRYEVWYDTAYFCLGCGDSWAGGELHQRPFAPGWRRKAIRKHEEMWERARPMRRPPSIDQMDPGFRAQAEAMGRAG